jgi:hypothetical protein
MSLVEAILNVAACYGLAVLTQMPVFPIFGLQVSLSDNLVMGLADLYVPAAKTVRGVPEAGCGDGDRRAGRPAATIVLSFLSLGFFEQPAFEVLRCGHAFRDGAEPEV